MRPPNPRLGPSGLPGTGCGPAVAAAVEVANAALTSAATLALGNLRAGLLKLQNLGTMEARALRRAANLGWVDYGVASAARRSLRIGTTYPVGSAHNVHPLSCARGGSWRRGRGLFPFFCFGLPCFASALLCFLPCSALPCSALLCSPLPSPPLPSERDGGGSASFSSSVLVLPILLLPCSAFCYGFGSKQFQLTRQNDSIQKRHNTARTWRPTSTSSTPCAPALLPSRARCTLERQRCVTVSPYPHIPISPSHTVRARRSAATGVCGWGCRVPWLCSLLLFSLSLSLSPT